MEIKMINSDKALELKKKYPSNFRKAMKYYGSNIPEQYWFTKLDHPKYSSVSLNVMDAIVESEDVIIWYKQDEAFDKPIHIISDAMMNNKSNRDGMLFEFNFIMGKTYNKFNPIQIDPVMNELSKNDFVAFYGIVPGQNYNILRENFESLLKNFLYSNKRTNFIIALPALENDNEIKDAYGDVIDSINKRDKEFKILKTWEF